MMVVGTPLFIFASLVVQLLDERQPPRTPTDRELTESSREPLGVPVCAIGIRDQSSPACLQASSLPTSGLLFPYPGQNNLFTPPAMVAGGVNNEATGTESFVGGGGTNRALGGWATVGGGSGNLATQDFDSVGGGLMNVADGPWATVGGGVGGSATGDGATVAGGIDNSAVGVGATVGGGMINEASGDWASVLGGQYNRATDLGATVGGGGGNEAAGYCSAIGGGFYNVVTGDYSTIAGGGFNSAQGEASSICGGFYNVVGAKTCAATVAGGSHNEAHGDFSFAAGRRAKAHHDGAFVWGDSSDVDKTSSAADEFNVYASGGARFFSAVPGTTGVLLAPGGGSWSSVSDRATKENLEAVDGNDVLRRLRELPISTWNYRTQGESVRHMGPMAQDFYATFGLGLGEKTIDTTDPDGVALAAIQGLDAKLVRLLAERDREIVSLRAELDELRRRVAQDRSATNAQEESR